MDEAALYVRAVVDSYDADRPPAGMADASAQVNEFAARFGYNIVARYQDGTSAPLPGTDSAFAELLDGLDQGVATVVLVPAKKWLAPIEEAQRRMADMIGAHGGTLVFVDSAEALGIAPPLRRGNDPSDPTKPPA